MAALFCALGCDLRSVHEDMCLGAWGREEGRGLPSTVGSVSGRRSVLLTSLLVGAQQSGEDGLGGVVGLVWLRGRTLLDPWGRLGREVTSGIIYEGGHDWVCTWDLRLSLSWLKIR